MKLLLLCALIGYVSCQYGGGNNNNYGMSMSAKTPAAEEDDGGSGKLRFNIGFNVPSMSISLPKLELPQISIRAAIKQRKPFRLQLPKISFSSSVSATEEDDEPAPEKPSYGNNNNYQANNNNYQSNNNNYQQQVEQPQPAQNYGQNNGGYGAASSNNYQEEGAAYNPAPVNNAYNQLDNAQRGYATGFQGRAVSDYKSAAASTGYYAPAAPVLATNNNNNHQQQQQQSNQNNNYQARNNQNNNQQQQQATYQPQQVNYNQQPLNNNQNNQYANQEVQNFGARLQQANNQYQRRNYVQQSAASELSNSVMLLKRTSSPIVDYSSWQPIFPRGHPNMYYGYL
jgi:hypothetical protein